MKLLRMALAGLLVAFSSVPAMAQGVKVPLAEDFSQIAHLPEGKRLPILVMFSAPGCSYCRRLEEEFLKPMIKSGEYDDKVIIRKVQMSAGATVVDFDGKTVPVNELASRYKVVVTPTVVLVDSRGHQLARKLVGFSSPDFYGSYLDSAIETALTRLHSAKVVARNQVAGNP